MLRVKEIAMDQKLKPEIFIVMVDNDIIDTAWSDGDIADQRVEVINKHTGGDTAFVVSVIVDDLYPDAIGYMGPPATTY
jgi:sulfur carrier protein ThiS